MLLCVQTTLSNENKLMFAKTKKQKPLFVAVDTVIFTIMENKLNVLLIKIKFGPLSGKCGAPGGRVTVNETLDEAARRELYEKTGVKNVYLEQLYSFGGLKRDPGARTISIAYFALVDRDSVRLKATKKYEDIKWLSVDKLGKLAYDHNEIINYALLRLRYKLEYTNIVYGLMPEKFTLSQLQKVYEIVLGKKLDKRNFRRKILSLGLIKKAGKEKSVPYRPSKFYSFKIKKPAIIEVF